MLYSITCSFSLPKNSFRIQRYLQSTSNPSSLFYFRYISDFIANKFNIHSFVCPNHHVLSLYVLSSSSCSLEATETFLLQHFPTLFSKDQQTISLSSLILKGCIESILDRQLLLLNFSKITDSLWQPISNSNSTLDFNFSLSVQNAQISESKANITILFEPFRSFSSSFSLPSTVSSQLQRSTEAVALPGYGEGIPCVTLPSMSTGFALSACRSTVKLKSEDEIFKEIFEQVDFFDFNHLCRYWKSVYRITLPMGQKSPIILTVSRGFDTSPLYYPLSTVFDPDFDPVTSPIKFDSGKVVSILTEWFSMLDFSENLNSNFAASWTSASKLQSTATQSTVVKFSSKFSSVSVSKPTFSRPSVNQIQDEEIKYPEDNPDQSNLIDHEALTLDFDPIDNEMIDEKHVEIDKRPKGLLGLIHDVTNRKVEKKPLQPVVFPSFLKKPLVNKSKQNVVGIKQKASEKDSEMVERGKKDENVKKVEDEGKVVKEPPKKKKKKEETQDQSKMISELFLKGLGQEYSFYVEKLPPTVISSLPFTTQSNLIEPTSVTQKATQNEPKVINTDQKEAQKPPADVISLDQARLLQSNNQLSSLTLPQLKGVLKEAKLKVGGKKAELVERLVVFFSENS
ncbi:hypothetical protein RCL1_004985 [Eukaryota sp. TZLM3-RCL]